ncbi:hypothetical protein AABB24_007975, partial [Solanum stoloniferum]
SLESTTQRCGEVLWGSRINYVINLTDLLSSPVQCNGCHEVQKCRCYINMCDLERNDMSTSDSQLMWMLWCIDEPKELLPNRSCDHSTQPFILRPYRVVITQLNLLPLALHLIEKNSIDLLPSAPIGVVITQLNLLP